MAMTPGVAPSRIFYGWWVSLAIIVLLSSGIRFTIGPFLKPVTADLGLDRGSFSLVLAVSLFFFYYGAFMPLAGRFVDRFGARVVCALGALVMAASLVLTGTLFLVRDPRLLLIVASALAGNLFGRYSVGSLFGLIFLSHQAGAALGSWLGGARFDLTAGYGAAFAVAAALLLIAAELSIAIDETVRPIRAVSLPGRPHPVVGGR